MRTIIALLALAVAAIAAFIVFAGSAALDPIEPPSATSFAGASLARGAQLVAVGDCNVCHTADGGRAFAGQRAIPTPFGTLYSSNITPDPETGIGRWSEAAFARALRQGVGRRGVQLYPAFPYDHFGIASDEDIKAIYAFLMTREPVRIQTLPGELRFPFNLRPLLAGWKWLYLKQPRYVEDSAQASELSRGAYLVHGLGHCGACHTPRNMLGAERKTEALSGGEVDGWDAPALNAASPSPRRWTVDSLFRYLRSEVANEHGIPAGPMGPVTHNLSAATDDDVRAIATYIASLMPPVQPEREKRLDELIAAMQRNEAFQLPDEFAGAGETTLKMGALLYAGACASCHDRGRQLSTSGDAMYLPLGTALYMSTPRNLLRIVIHGITPLEGERGRWMPGFDTAFTDEQLAALVVYLRARFTDSPPWANVGNEAKQARQQPQG